MGDTGGDTKHKGGKHSTRGSVLGVTQHTVGHSTRGETPHRGSQHSTQGGTAQHMEGTAQHTWWRAQHTREDGTAHRGTHSTQGDAIQYMGV